MSAVDVAAVVKNYGAQKVLDDIAIHFQEGAFTSLLGPSGSGKTTLLRIVAGFVTPDQGVVRIGADDVTRVPVHARNIGMVFQSYALFPHMTVMENIAFGLHRRGVRGAEATRRARQALDLVQLSHLGERRPKQLSGGQQQRVALARAIVFSPSVLLLDEPLSALDRRLRQDMQVELRRIQQESGLTTIFVTHDQEEALTLSDHIAILDGGRIVQEGAPAQIYEHPRTRFAASFLGDANFLSGPTMPGGIEIDGRPIKVAMPFETRGRATVAVRPEKMSIDGPGENRIPAVIRQIVYAGATTTYLLDGPEGLPFRVFTQNHEANLHPVGSAVWLTWSPAHTILLAE
ncbi:putative spermidine/putrescine transport system ATP-binding protein/spermidine/putrescine transport system ATP-binding protein [Arboricoccus pini]|uniref:Putative spermidine/putrescine transport system ATP-binding protein/spermidine/putrescine transport system ATP-binding protein n=1 Tax=Arboricoccus pini TaxID=1963835 RepID=A0A212RJ01_9PROT|nr:ABC transporter ATP-binding protein [Arboricoccus pini]SNB72393.1 putative spermidine/putrescine transport system ATP-binding protein/spermidine/putrescine transport system ATP-binding protein [Arboricoccus pini]